MFNFMQIFLIMLLITSIIGYILVVLKEKIYLKNNIILIDNKFVTQDHLDDTDMKEFYLDGTMLKSGDEIKVITRREERFIGVLIGAIQKEKSILLITHSNKILKFKVENIKQFQIVSKYGKFFSK